MTKWLVTYVSRSGEGKSEVDVDGVFDTRKAKECVEKDTGLVGISIISFRTADPKDNILSGAVPIVTCNQCSAMFGAKSLEIAKALAGEHLKNSHNDPVEPNIYLTSWVQTIKEAKSDEEMAEFVDRIYMEGFEDGFDDATNNPLEEEL